MFKLLPITAICLILTAFSHAASTYDPIECRYYKKDRFWYAIMAVCLILFAGLRTDYNDTGTYLEGYQKYRDGLYSYENIDWLSIGNNPGFVYVMGLMIRMNFHESAFIMCFSIFMVGVNLWFFHKYSCNIWLTIMLYITFAGYLFSLAAIKQCTAMAFCLIATDRAIRKKYIPFVIYVLIGSLFHAYALMYLLVPFLFFRPWSKMTVFMLIVFGAIGFGMQSLVGTLLNVTDMMGESYDAASFTGEGVNPVRLLVTAVPVFLSYLSAKQIAQTEERDQYLITNLTMLNAEIMFVGLFGTANYFARLANYFLPFQAVSIPWLFKHYDYKSQRLLVPIAVFCYFMFFVYSFAVNENFDSSYFRYTVWEYIQVVFLGEYF